MFFFVIALLIGEYCLALIIKFLFNLKFDPAMEVRLVALEPFEVGKPRKRCFEKIGDW